MPDFAFTPYNEDRPHEETDLLKSRAEAVRLRDHLKSQGHKAVVEGSAGEHRVRVAHPTDKDTIAYVHNDQLDKKGNFKPYWIAK